MRRFRISEVENFQGGNVNRMLPIGSVSSHFSEVLAGMIPGEAKAVITRTERTSWPSVAGTAKDRSLWMAADFDAPLEDYEFLGEPGTSVTGVKKPIHATA